MRTPGHVLSASVAFALLCSAPPLWAQAPPEVGTTRVFVPRPPLVVEVPDPDIDGDGRRNSVDLDDDGDGVPDEIDAFPLDRRESRDTDADGTGDAGEDPGLEPLPPLPPPEVDCFLDLFPSFLDLQSPLFFSDPIELAIGQGFAQVRPLGAGCRVSSGNVSPSFAVTTPLAVVSFAVSDELASFVGADTGAVGGCRLAVDTRTACMKEASVGFVFSDGAQDTDLTERLGAVVFLTLVP